MHAYAVLAAIAVNVCGLSACTHKPQREQFSECIAGKQCQMEGQLRLHAGQPTWVALLEINGKCAKLAFPDDFYVNAKKWEGKKVIVNGRAFAQPGFDESDGTVTLWYTERDRKLGLGICDSGVGIYVESMRSGTGKEWPAPAP